jgi:peptidoglycan/LPS O-acetylase OafA/YrhL
METIANLPIANSLSPSAKSKYRPEIDGLRAFAIIAVIINHFNKDILPSGYLGVDIFFVISGYVITSSLSGRESKNFGDYLIGFYERRVRRLVPALVIFVLVTGIAVNLLTSSPETALKTGIASLFGYSNLYLLKQSTDYFAQSSELNPFTHTWSLGVEEQFYLLFPLLAWYSGFAKQTNNGSRTLLFAVGILSFASLSAFIYLYQENQPASYFLMPCRFWEMAAGCAIFIGLRINSHLQQFLNSLPPLIPIIGILGAMFLPVRTQIPATITVIVLSTVLIACLKEGSIVYEVFTDRRAVYIGLISYSLYLWHWSILTLIRLTIGLDFYSGSFGLVATFAISALSYKYIEKIPRERWGSLKKSLTVSTGLAALVFSAIILALIQKQKISFIPRNITLTPPTDAWIERMDCHGKRTNQLRNPFAYCLKDRAIYQTEKSRRFYWLGGSHAAQMMKMSDIALANTDFQTAYIRTASKNDIVNAMEGLKIEWINTPTGKEIYRQSKRGDVLALIIKRDRWGDPKEVESQIMSRRVFNVENQIIEFFTALNRKGVKTIIVRDTAELHKNISLETCLLQKRLRGGNYCDMDAESNAKSRKLQDAMYDRVISSLAHAGIEVFSWDPAVFMPQVNGKYTFLLPDGNYSMYDYSHLSESGSLFLGKYFKQFLKSSNILQ